MIASGPGSGRTDREDMTLLDLGRRLSPALSIIAYLLLLVIVVRTRNYAAMNHDVAWLVLCAERWLHGAVFGVDLMEINLPGAMLLYVPPVYLAEITGLPRTVCVDLWVGLVCVPSAILVARVVATLDGRHPSSRQAFLTGLMLAPGLIFLPGSDFAQREQFVAVLLLPYAVLSMAGPRWQGSALLRHVTAVLAALAICIKPHYVLLLAIGFLIQVYRGGWRQALRHSDAALIFILGLGYVALVLTAFAPWVAMMRSMSHFYLAYGSPFSAILVAALWPALLILPGVFIANFNLVGARTLRTFLVYAGVALLLFLLQGKGWEYHALPIKLFLWTGLAVVFVANLPRLVMLSKYPALTSLAVLLVPVMLTQWAWQIGIKDRVRYEQFVEDIGIRRFAKPGDPVLFITATQSLPFPLVLHENYVWALRYPAIWPLAGIFARESLQPELTDPNDITAAGRVADEIAADVVHYRPKVIVIDDRKIQPYLPTGCHYLPLLQRFDAFNAAWANYELGSSTTDYAIYVRRGD